MKRAVARARRVSKHTDTNREAIFIRLFPAESVWPRASAPNRLFASLFSKRRSPAAGLGQRGNSDCFQRERRTAAQISGETMNLLSAPNFCSFRGFSRNLRLNAKHERVSLFSLSALSHVFHSAQVNQELKARSPK